MKETICFFVSLIAELAVLFALLFNTPDSFASGGAYFKMCPVWVYCVYTIGVLAISMFAAVASFGIMGLALGVEDVRPWVTSQLRKLRKLRRPSVYKFNK